MAKFAQPLDNIKIASPCSQDWEAMIGVGRKRYCSECRLNVYNLSGMTRREAESLLMNSEGRLCVRFYRRQDGTILMQDCPVGWQALKKRISKTSAAFVSLLFGLLSGIGFMNFLSQPERKNVTSEFSIESSNEQAMLNDSNISILMGDVAVEKTDDAAWMGMPSIEQPNPWKSKRK